MLSYVVSFNLVFSFPLLVYKSHMYDALRGMFIGILI